MKRRGFVSLAAAAFLVFLRDVAQAFCNPSLVRLLGEVRQLVQTRSGKGPSLGHYFIQWYGHSSFLIHSGSQTKVVADPNFNVTPGIQADAVTVSNDHFTHNNTGAVTGNPIILRGITFRQTWNPIRTSVKDITIVNIPSQRGPSWGAIANSIFIYEMGSLCLAHLGNIGHLLTPEQEKVMQRVDVMMIPIDALTVNVKTVFADTPELVPHYNDWAVRDRPRSITRPSNVRFRSVLVGDSFLEGYWTDAGTLDSLAHAN